MTVSFFGKNPRETADRSATKSDLMGDTSVVEVVD